MSSRPESTQYSGSVPILQVNVHLGESILLLIQLSISPIYFHSVHCAIALGLPHLNRALDRLEVGNLLQNRGLGDDGL